MMWPANISRLRVKAILEARLLGFGLSLEGGAENLNFSLPGLLKIQVAYRGSFSFVGKFCPLIKTKSAAGPSMPHREHSRFVVEVTRIVCFSTK